jgi:polar amino acid transport system permease protein
MVVQLLLAYYVILPTLGIKNVEALNVGIAVFGLNSGAYVSEIMRGGINSVDKGQMEAGRSLGFGYTQTMVKIVVPQAFKNILPTLGNEFISLIKETSVLSLIAVTDLTKSFKAIAESTYEYFIPYIMLAITYFVIVLLISLLVKIMERRLAKSDR